MFKLHLRYVYTFYSFGDLLGCETLDECVEVEAGKRFTLYQQEDSSFLLSGGSKDAKGNYIVLTYPNKDRVVVYEGDSAAFVYDEYYDSMGDDNHNVYEGFVTLEAV